jgi:hypothetical protein
LQLHDLLSKKITDQPNHTITAIKQPMNKVIPSLVKKSLVEIEQGNSVARQEVSDGNEAVRGSYSYTDIQVYDLFII